MVWLALALSVVPSLLLLWYFVKSDRFPEPMGVVVPTFGLGILITVPVIALAYLTQPAFQAITNLYQFALVQAFVSAAIPEELLKLAVLVWFCKRHSAFDEPMDGVVYGATVALGFATLENLLYAAQGGLDAVLVRAVTAVPGHAALGVIMGTFVALAHFVPRRRAGYMTLAALIPVLLHGLYDLPLMMLNAPETAVPALDEETTLSLALLALVAMMTEMVYAFLLHRRLRRMQARLAKRAGVK